MRKSSYFAAHFLQRIFLVKQVCTFLPLSLGFRAAVRCKTGIINHAATLFSPIRVFFPLLLPLDLRARIIDPSVSSSAASVRSFPEAPRIWRRQLLLPSFPPTLFWPPLEMGKKCSEEAERGGGESEKERRSSPARRA